MRIATIILLGMSTATAVAQPTPGANPTTGARPGHEIGVGDSLPRSSNATNITAADTKSTIAPTLPASSIGTNASTQDYLRAARASLVGGKMGATQQSLEMAETRALDRSVPADQTAVPSQSTLVGLIRDARRALGDGDKQGAIRIIDTALSS